MKNSATHQNEQNQDEENGTPLTGRETDLEYCNRIFKNDAFWINNSYLHTEDEASYIREVDGDYYKRKSQQQILLKGLLYFCTITSASTLTYLLVHKPANLVKPSKAMLCFGIFTAGLLTATCLSPYILDLTCNIPLEEVLMSKPNFRKSHENQLKTQNNLSEKNV